MNNKVYIGIDNGVSGSIGIIFPDKEALFIKTPTKKVFKYTKKKQKVTRIDYTALVNILSVNITQEYKNNCFILLERPMVNPGRFVATSSALRSLEATLIALEQLSLPYQFIDSKEWQKELLPKGAKGAELKTASLEVGSRLFPHLKDLFSKQKDSDGMLIAEYAKRKNY